MATKKCASAFFMIAIIFTLIQVMSWKLTFTSSTLKQYYPKQREASEKNEITNFEIQKDALDPETADETTNKENEITNFEIPEDALDPETAYYGIIHKDTYGLPLSDFGLQTFQKKQENWEVYFPDLMTSLEQYKNENPTQNPDYFTSALTSTVSMDRKRQYKVGDVFEAEIQSRETSGKNKTFGGDYYRASLLLINPSNNDAPDGIPCTIEDEMNGTYKIKAPLEMHGNFTLEVKLVVPLEVIEKLIEWTEISNTPQGSYQALLSSNATVRCDAYLSKDISSTNSELCDYSNPRNSEPWFCEKPPSGICERILDIQYLTGRKGFLLTPEESVKSNFQSIKIESQVGEIFVNDSEKSNEFNDDSSQKLIPGYSTNSRWVSLVHHQELSALEYDQLKVCFENKVGYMFGDSTIRQFYYLAVDKLKLSSSGPNNDRVWQNPQIGRGYDDNIAIYFRAHGPPLLNPGPPSSRPYISDSIDGIAKGGSDVYVIFNIGVHLIEHGASFYLHRLKGIKAAILRHLSKFPQTRFILRGMNVVEFAQHEWLIRRYDVILRNLFKEIDQVKFVDFWGLTTVWPLDDYHPRGDILILEALLLFDYICH